MNKTRILLITGCALGVLAIIVQAVNQLRSPEKNNSLMKFEMPGRYKIGLAKNRYQVWAFDKWTSRHIVGQFPSDGDLAVQGPAGSVTVIKLPENAADLYETTRSGKLIWSVETTREDFYDITCSVPCVVVLARTDAVQCNLGSNFEVIGLENDDGFVRRP